MATKIELEYSKILDEKVRQVQVQNDARKKAEDKVLHLEAAL